MQYGKNRNRLQILVSQISENIYRTDSSKSENVNVVIVRVTLYLKKYILLNYKISYAKICIIFFLLVFFYLYVRFISTRMVQPSLLC